MRVFAWVIACPPTCISIVLGEIQGCCALLYYHLGRRRRSLSLLKCLLSNEADFTFVSSQILFGKCESPD